MNQPITITTPQAQEIFPVIQVKSVPFDPNVPRYCECGRQLRCGYCPKCSDERPFNRYVQ